MHAMREQLRQLREFRIAGAERRDALAGKAGEPVEHVHGIVGAALFAVILGGTRQAAGMHLSLSHANDSEDTIGTGAPGATPNF